MHQRSPKPMYRMRLPLVILAAMYCAAGAESSIAKEEYYSPPTRTSHPTQVYWGDTHLHTTLSVDSAGRGNEALTPNAAYRFARGDGVRTNNGEAFKLDRPLDFLVVADHGINMGVVSRMQERDPEILATEVGRRWRSIWDQFGWTAGEKLNEDSFEEWQSFVRTIGSNSAAPEAFFWQAWNDEYVADPRFRRSVWDEVCQTADRHYEPGRFTAFIGYEWTPAASNPRAPFLHRVVVFKGDKFQACQVLPFTAKDSANVERLWDYLESYENDTGDEVLAIPHGSNMTNGMMFAPKTFDGEELSRAYMETRQRWERLLEVKQIKGDSESHPLLSPTDEFADFETWPPFRDNTVENARYEYARSALRLGLEHQAAQGVNPFKYGMIGSSDSHTGVSSTAEDNFTGNYPLIEPSRHRAKGAWWFSASGLAAVWATENSRPALFAAMKRREVYATTGTRMSLRFFGGWDFIQSPDFVEIGYDRGVPMGGDLTAAPGGASPTFMIQVARDPMGANLDRIQVVKGWVDGAGKSHEKVFDVALSDGRRPDHAGQIPPVGNTVNEQTATYSNAIGDPELATTWSDPDFDPRYLAFYYVRALEIPTPRWTTHDKAFYEISELPDNVPTVIQERAYSSPIWYTP